MKVNYTTVIELECLPGTLFKKDGEPWKGMQAYSDGNGEGFIAKVEDTAYHFIPLPLYEDEELTILFASSTLKTKLKEYK